MMSDSNPPEATPPASTTWLEEIAQDFRKQYDELGLKPPKNSMPGLERELIIDFWRKALSAHLDDAVRTAVQTAITTHHNQYHSNAGLMPEKANCDDAVLAGRIEELEALQQSDIANVSLNKMQIRINGRITALQGQQKGKDE